MIYFVIILILSVFMWSNATGFREGFTWQNARRRAKTPLPLFDYHTWRYIEQFSIFGSIIATAFIGWQAIIIYWGANWFFVYVSYEPCLDYMVQGRWIWFKSNNPYTIRICGKEYTFNNGTAYQITLTLIGLTLTIIGAYYA